MGTPRSSPRGLLDAGAVSRLHAGGGGTGAGLGLGAPQNRRGCCGGGTPLEKAPPFCPHIPAVRALGSLRAGWGLGLSPEGGVWGWRRPLFIPFFPFFPFPLPPPRCSWRQDRALSPRTGRCPPWPCCWRPPGSASPSTAPVGWPDPPRPPPSPERGPWGWSPGPQPGPGIPPTPFFP